MEEMTRQEFKGEWIYDKVTEQYERDYPSGKRAFKYLQSVLISLPWFLLTLCMMICFLNLNGYLNENENSILYCEFLADMSQAGGWVDSTSGYWYMIPTIAQPLVTRQFNLIFRFVH
jgi:hypothetical protein